MNDVLKFEKESIEWHADRLRAKWNETIKSESRMNLTKELGSEADILPTEIGGGTESAPSLKPKRKRKEWVYKSDYDELDQRREFCLRVAVIGWVAFFCTVLAWIFMTAIKA